MTSARLLTLNPDDDVAIALAPIGRGEPTGPGPALTDVPRRHKIALTDLPAGALVHKYGHVIGMASRPIRAGEHVHTHNLTMPPNAAELAGSDHAGGVVCHRARPPAAHLRRHRPARRPGGHPQLHRRADHGELLGHGGQADRAQDRGRDRRAARRRRATAWSG